MDIYICICACVCIYILIYVYTHTPGEAVQCQTLNWVLLSQQAFETEDERILWAIRLLDIAFILKVQNLSSRFLVEEGRQPPTHDLQGVNGQTCQLWTVCISIRHAVWESTQPNQNGFRNRVFAMRDDLKFGSYKRTQEVI